MIQVHFVQGGSEEFDLISLIAERARRLDVEVRGRRAASKLHHQMNVSACHASGNPLRLAELLEADNLNFYHDILGIDRHIDRDTGKLLNCFRPRYSRREAA